MQQLTCQHVRNGCAVLNALKCYQSAENKNVMWISSFRQGPKNVKRVVRMFRNCGKPIHKVGAINRTPATLPARHGDRYHSYLNGRLGSRDFQSSPLERLRFEISLQIKEGFFKQIPGKRRQRVARDENNRQGQKRIPV